jgi:TonB family protein
MLAAILTAALSVPVLSISIGDYPEDALSAEVSAAALVRVVVDPTGKALSCEALQSFGNQRLAREICPILRRRRHEAAHLRDGTKSWGQITALYRLFIPGTEQGAKMQALREAPTGSLQINHLPGGAAKANVKIVIAVDASGQVLDCGADHDEKQTQLVEALCASPAALARKPLLTPTSEAVTYVTDLQIELLATPAAP